MIAKWVYHSNFTTVIVFRGLYTILKLGGSTLYEKHISTINLPFLLNNLMDHDGISGRMWLVAKMLLQRNPSFFGCLLGWLTRVESEAAAARWI